MRIILDENLPRPLKRAFISAHRVTTVQEEGMASFENGVLIALLEETFDVFVTADKNLRYQQNLTERTLAIVELPTNRWPLLQRLFQRITAAVETAEPGAYIQIEM